MQFEQQYITKQENIDGQSNGKKIQGIAVMTFVLAYFLDFLIIVGKNYYFSTPSALMMTATVMSVFASLLSLVNFVQTQRLVSHISTFFYFVGGLLYVSANNFLYNVDDLMVEYIYLSIIGAAAALILGDKGDQNQDGRMKQESYGIVIMIFLTLYYVNDLSRWSMFRQQDFVDICVSEYVYYSYYQYYYVVACFQEINYVDLMIASYVIAIVGCLISITAGLQKSQIPRFLATFFIFVAAVLNLAGLICYIVKLHQIYEDIDSQSQEWEQSQLLFLLFANQFTFYIGLSASQLMSE